MKYVEKIGRTACWLVIAASCLFCLAGCGEGTPPTEQETPPEEQQAPPAEEISEAEPAPERPSLPWEAPAQAEPLSYDAYFSEVRIYDWDMDIVRGMSLDPYVLRYDAPELYLCNYQTEERLWTVAEIDHYCWTVADENWIYGVVDGRELVRMDYWGENRQTLFVDDTQRLGYCVDRGSFLAGGETLFFLAGSGDGLAVWRLYLPELQTDILFDGISAEGLGPELDLSIILDAPVSNHEITWTTESAEFNELFERLYSDSDTPYSAEDEDTARGMVELDYDMYSGLAHYVNSDTGEYYEMPFGYTYLLMPRSAEDIAANGDAWWKDFQNK